MQPLSMTVSKEKLKRNLKESWSVASQQRLKKTPTKRNLKSPKLLSLRLALSRTSQRLEKTLMLKHLAPKLSLSDSQLLRKKSQKSSRIL